jgi:hypothetical protein
MRSRREANWLALAAPHPSSHWTCGQLVRAAKGPLAGHIMFFEGLLSHHRAWVVTNLLGGAKASINISSLEDTAT